MKRPKLKPKPKIKIKKGYKYYIEYRECTFPENHIYTRNIDSSKVDVISVWDKDGYYGTYFYNTSTSRIERISFSLEDTPKRIGDGEYTNDYVECFDGYTKCIIA